MKFFTALSVLALSGLMATAANSAGSFMTRDSGTVQVEVWDLYLKPERKNHFGKVKVEAVSQYRHYQDTDYEPLKPGDEIEVYFYFGTEPRRIPAPSGGGGENYLEIPGVRTGDKIEAYIYGCPSTSSCGSGWSFYRYTVLERAPTTALPPPPPPSEPPAAPSEPEPDTPPVSEDDFSAVETPLSPLPDETTKPSPSEPTGINFWRLAFAATSVILAGAGLFFIWRGFRKKGKKG